MRINETDLSIDNWTLWLKAKCAADIRNHGHAITLYQELLKAVPGFLAGRKALRASAMAATKKKHTQLLAGVAFVNPSADPYADMEAAERILGRDPFSPAGNRLLKDAALSVGDVETAVFALETWLEGHPENPEVSTELALLIGAGVPEAPVITPVAVSAPAVVAVEEPVPAPVLVVEQPAPVVSALYEPPTIDEQIAILSDKALDAPFDFEFPLKIAELYEQKKDLENAIIWFKQADQLSGGEEPSLREKIRQLEMQKIGSDIKEREEWLLQDAEHHEERPRVRKEVEELKEWKNSVLLETTKASVAENPEDLALRYQMGELLVNAGEFTDAIRELQKVRSHPEFGMLAATLLGQCFSAKGMHDLAFRQFTNEAEEMDSTKKLMTYKLGTVYENMGQLDKALDCFKQIYEIDYDYEDVAARVEKAYELV